MTGQHFWGTGQQQQHFRLSGTLFLSWNKVPGSHRPMVVEHKGAWWKQWGLVTKRVVLGAGQPWQHSRWLLWGGEQVRDWKKGKKKKKRQTMLKQVEKFSPGLEHFFPPCGACWQIFAEVETRGDGSQLQKKVQKMSHLVETGSWKNSPREAQSHCQGQFLPSQRPCPLATPLASTMPHLNSHKNLVPSKMTISRTSWWVFSASGFTIERGRVALSRDQM